MSQIDFQSPDIPYSYKATFLLLGPCSYRYTVSNGITIEARIPYVYTGVEPEVNNKVIGYRSDYTQIIANGLQDWNRIRKCSDSTGQSLINAIAMGLGEVTEYWKDERRELFLETADPNSVWSIARYGLPSHIDFDEQDSPNLLVNSSFSSPAVSRYNLPIDWTDRWDYSNGHVELHSQDSLVGTNCVRLNANTGQRAGIWQQQDFVVPKGQKLTFSAWYKTYETQDYNFTGDSNSFLQVSLTYDDRTTSTTKKSLKHGTNGKWIREYLTVTGERDVGVINVGIELDNTDGAMDERVYFIDACMLERGDHPSQWTPNIVDQPEWMRVYEEFFIPPFCVDVWQQTGTYTGTISGYTATGSLNPKIGLQYVENAELFFSRNLPPTRVLVRSETGSVNGINNQIYGQIANSIEEPFEKGWRINGDGISTYTWPFTQDTGSFYYFAEPGLNKEAIRTTLAQDQFALYHKYTKPQTDLCHTGGYNYSVDYEAMTIKDGMIWLICEESWTGDSNKVLKLLNPRTERTKDYLELIRDYRLTGLTGVVTSIGFTETSPHQISVSMTGDSLAYSGAIIDLYYDYFTYNPSLRQVYTRHMYTGSTQTLVIA